MATLVNVKAPEGAYKILQRLGVGFFFFFFFLVFFEASVQHIDGCSNVLSVYPLLKHLAHTRNDLTFVIVFCAFLVISIGSLKSDGMFYMFR